MGNRLVWRHLATDLEIVEKGELYTMYEYKFVIIPISKGLTSKKTKEVEIRELEKKANEYAGEGWRLSQIFSPLGEGNVSPDNYVLILERKK